MYCMAYNKFLILQYCTLFSHILQSILRQDNFIFFRFIHTLYLVDFLPSFPTEIHFLSYGTYYRRVLYIATGFLFKHSRFCNLFDRLNCHIIAYIFFQDTGSDIFVILFINFVFYQKLQHLRHVHIRLCRWADICHCSHASHFFYKCFKLIRLWNNLKQFIDIINVCLLYTSPSPRD